MAKKKMNDGLRDMLNNLDAGRENDLRSRIGELERMGYAAAGRMPEAATSQGVDDAGIVRTLSDEISLQEEVGTANGLQINWWLPLTLADDDITHIGVLKFHTVGWVKYLYAGGLFNRIGGIDVANIARYSFVTRQWEQVNGGVNGMVIDLAWDPADDKLFIVGAFTDAGGDTAADYIAKDDGAGSWTHHNTVITGTPFCYLICLNFSPTGVLHIGGYFQNAGGDALADMVAKDNGAGNWVNVCGGGINTYVYGIEWDAAGVLHICGNFTNAGGNPIIDYVAKDNGAGGWAEVCGGSLAATTVTTLKFSPDNILHISGIFSNAGGDPTANMIAYDNNGAWAGIGSGFSSMVRNFAWDNDGNLIAVGSFTNAGGDPLADRIAILENVEWRSISNGGGLSGLTDDVWTVVVDTNGTVFAGGEFNTAGTIQTKCLAAYVVPLSDAIDMIAGLFEQYQARANTQPQWFKKIKAVDESVNNSAVMQSDDELAMTLKANGIYAVRGRVWFNTLAAADFKYRFYMPGGTLMYCKHTYYPAGSSTGTTTIETVIPTVSTSVLGTLALAGYIEFDILVKVDAAVRNIVFQWAQDTATVGNTTVLAGSYIEACPAG